MPRQVLDRVEIDIERINKWLPDMIEEHFPKGKCREREYAVILVSVLMDKLTEEKPIKIKGE